MNMRTVHVFDDRTGTPKLVATHENVQEDWSTHQIIKRFGIAEHLRVVQILDGRVRTLQAGGHVL